MKKYFYVAIMALTLGMFASCTGVYTPTEPVCDDQAGTINGKAYNNTDYACYKITETATSQCTGEEAEYEEYVYLDWCTEYQAQKTKANFEYSSNAKACAYGYCCENKGTCTIEKTNHTEDECYTSNL